MVRRLILSILAPLIALCAQAAAATVTFDGTSADGEAVTIRITTDDDNLGRDLPPYLSFLDIVVEAAGRVYSVDQGFYRDFGVGDRIVSGTLDGGALSLRSEGDFYSSFIGPRAGRLDEIVLSFAVAFQGPLTIDTLFDYLAGARLIGASGSAGGFSFELVGPGDLSAVPVPAAAWLFVTVLSGLGARRLST